MTRKYALHEHRQIVRTVRQDAAVWSIYVRPPVEMHRFENDVYPVKSQNGARPGLHSNIVVR